MSQDIIERLFDLCLIGTKMTAIEIGQMAEKHFDKREVPTNNSVHESLAKLYGIWHILKRDVNSKHEFVYWKEE